MARSRSPFRPAALLLSAILPLAIAGCGGVETYRSITGVNRNDPDPQTALFTGNLAEAEKGPYPNLASVPPPPTAVTTAAERKKLADGLLADRAAAEAAAKLPPGLGPPGAAPAAAKAPDKNAAKTAAAPAAPEAAAPSAAASAPPVAPSANAAAPSTPPAAPPASTAAAAPSPAPAPSAAVSSNSPSPPRSAAAPAPAAAPSGATPSTATTAANSPLPPVDAPPPGKPAAAQGKAKGLPGEKTASNDSQNTHRRTDEPPEPGPRDSTMEVPQVRSMPQPEANRAAPAPAPAALGRVAMPAPIAQPNPAIDKAAVPMPAPAVPELPPVPPPPTAAIAPQSRTPPPPSTVATLTIPSGAALDSNGRQQVERVAALYKEKPGNVRVVARTPPPAPGTDPLSGYHAALGGAQAVADALKAAGVPANKIQTEATPNVGAGGASAGRIDIQLAP